MNPQELLARNQALWVLDPTKLKDSLCLRYFFFKHILGWRSVKPNVHLTFGRAIHEARRVMLECPGAYTKESVEKAYEVFLKIYRKDYSDELDDENHPKSPLGAKRILSLYYCRYAEEDKDRRVIASEETHDIEVAEGRMLTIKLDTLLATGEGYYEVAECKSTMRQTRGWADAWHNSIQIWSYIGYAQARALREGTQCVGAVIDGLILHKNDVDLVRIAIPRTDEKLIMWREAVVHKMDRVVEEIARFAEEDEDAQVMKSWPQEGELCNRYRLCEYFTYCQAWPNPLKRCEQCPAEFEVDYWNPKEVRDD